MAGLWDQSNWSKVIRVVNETHPSLLSQRKRLLPSFGPLVLRATNTIAHNPLPLWYLWVGLQETMMDLPSFDYYADSQRKFTGRLSMQELLAKTARWGEAIFKIFYKIYSLIKKKKLSFPEKKYLFVVYSKSYNYSGYWFVSRNILSNIFLILTHNFVVRGCEVAVNHGRKVSIVGYNYSYSVLKSKETHPEMAPPNILEVL